ncbi:leucine-rich repeats and immunoglobulin-like domains protein 3 [Plutella xylostella]|uniref:leucine-rich repeats and immunoglobulin-like domains protein 3 n=1 Tax=Plutella xylostella TaxID=51655 RepID=UPI002032436D|nr:leucine-rich repeats and immunoglobulin-like domains protein 3 [Plutella xylostella]
MRLACLVALASLVAAEWRCPALSARPAAECSCDLPHTLRCAGDHTALQIIGRHLREQRARKKNSAVSLLDLSLRGVSALTAGAGGELGGAALHGLVISSGDIRRVQANAFNSLAATVMALGLPNNQLPSVPTEALARLYKLDRLDLSNNKIHTLDSNSFKGIQNLTFLDISDNQITDISADAFKPLLKLTVLRLRGNLLKVPALASLKAAQYLKDLDLSSNALAGPLSQFTLPSLPHLEVLQLADNTFASIRRGALAGLPNLTHLNLHNNQIDVLEDFSFRHLVNLTSLDLSHNEIVAVSGASLAQLTNLVRLDLSHNFLRSLSAEPLKSLDRLTDLLLHDNDISMIDDGALSDHKDLTRFTIEDNPLNCDCLMAGFARWLREAKNLTQSDKAAAICATPPHLEGALLSRLSKNKLCDDFEHVDTRIEHPLDKEPESINYDYNNIVNDKNDDVKGDADDNPMVVPNAGDGNYVDDKIDGLDDDIYDEELDIPTDEDLPISKTKIVLQDAWYDSEEVHLSWAVDALPSRRFRCTGVTVTKSGVIPKHVACHRATPANVVLWGLKIDPVELYTFCIAFEEMDTRDVPMALVLGCSSPQTVRQRVTFAPEVVAMPTTPTLPIVVGDTALRVSEVRSNVTTEGLLTVLISVLGVPSPHPKFLSRSQRLSADTRYMSSLNNCYVVLAVLSAGSLVAQKDTPCQATLEISMEGFVRGPYEVCATLSKYKVEDMRPICVVPQLMGPLGSLEMKAGLRNLNTALVGVSLGLMVLVVGLVWFVRKMLKKPAQFEPHRCFRQEPVPEETPRASYVMLTATSKV